MDNSLTIIISISVIGIAWAVATLYSRQQLQRARQRGHWPPLGQIPTDEDVKRLAKDGEKILAIRMCRQIHNLGFTEAAAVVEKLVERGATPNSGPATASGKPGVTMGPPSVN
jgi:hypothetical protein